MACRHPGNAVAMTRMVIAVAIAALLTGCGGSAPHAGSGSGDTAASGTAPTGSPQPRGSDFVGIYADDVFFGDASYRRSALAEQHAAGVQLIRQPFGWADWVREP